MSRLTLLILDANVVIHLHEFGLWSRLIAACDVHLPRTVVGEADYYEQDGEKRVIDLRPEIDQRRIQIFDVPLPDIIAFRNRFDPLYVDGLDPGESEALAYLCNRADTFKISSGDAIVYRVLGRLNRSDQGISLEEILQSIGLQRNQLPWSCRRAFRLKYTTEGEVDAIQGTGLKKGKNKRQTGGSRGARRVSDGEEWGHLTRLWSTHSRLGPRVLPPCSLPCPLPAPTVIVPAVELGGGQNVVPQLALRNLRPRVAGRAALAPTQAPACSTLTR